MAQEKLGLLGEGLGRQSSVAVRKNLEEPRSGGKRMQSLGRIEVFVPLSWDIITKKEWTKL